MPLSLRKLQQGGWITVRKRRFFSQSAAKYSVHRGIGLDHEFVCYPPIYFRGSGSETTKSRAFVRCNLVKTAKHVLSVFSYDEKRSV